MAKPRLSMRKIKELLRLKHTYALSKRQISQICNISRRSVTEYLERAEKAGISWPLPEGLTDQELEQRLFPSPPVLCGSSRPVPDFEYLYREFKAHKKFNLTLDLLWREYKEQHLNTPLRWSDPVLSRRIFRCATSSISCSVSTPRRT